MHRVLTSFITLWSTPPPPCRPSVWPGRGDRYSEAKQAKQQTKVSNVRDRDAETSESDDDSVEGYRLRIPDRFPELGTAPQEQ